MIVAGLMSGQHALESARQASPALSWLSIAVVYLGSVVGVVLVVGFQALRNDRRFGQIAFFSMSLITTYFLSAGLSATFYAQGLSPASLLFVAVGSGSTVGLLLARFIYRARRT